MRSTPASVTAFAPATVSNVACGFDVLGFALEAPGDEVTARITPGAAARAVTISEISGDRGRLPREGSRNTAGVAARALLEALGEHRGVELDVRKGLPLSSGLGGSAASAAAAVAAVDGLLGARAPVETLLLCALEGERIGAGSAHPDNVAPAIYGGFVLVRQANPPDIVRLPVPGDLIAVVVHPDLEVETALARAMLGDTVSLSAATRQWANLGALVDGLHRRDYALIGRALEDSIAEPRRASLVPGLETIKRAAVDAGALGSSLSGSGPSVFALCVGRSAGSKVAEAMRAAARVSTGRDATVYVSSIASRGARLVSTCDS